MKRVLAFDFGGSSGRALLSCLKDGRLEVSEIHRFENRPKQTGGRFCWDFDELFEEVKKALQIAHETGFDAVGIDTWGVDYGLIDKEGRLLGAPVHYRDMRTAAMFDAIDAQFQNKFLYEQTGIQPMRINTLYQLACDQKEGRLQKADKILMMPDLFAYLLSGEKRAEATIASTTGLFNAEKGAWDLALIERLGLPRSVFCEIIKPGEIYGYLKPEFANGKRIPVIAVCSHDTASAVLSMEESENSVFISSGTWSLMGVMQDKINLCDAGFTNEAGFAGKITYLKNIMGMWLMQQTKKALEAAGTPYTYDAFNALLEDTHSDLVLDPNAAEFELPENMKEAVESYCLKTQGRAPRDLKELLVVINQSLAMVYAKTYRQILQNCGRAFSTIQIVGGGSRTDFINQLTADLTGCTVLAGPVEATAIGNMLVQFFALGALKVSDFAAVIAKTEPIRRFAPSKPDEKMQKNCERFENLLR